jgi:hypothetical protein
MTSSGNAARVSAVALLFERGWGKAPQPHTGEDGENDVRITIRHTGLRGAALPHSFCDQA